MATSPYNGNDGLRMDSIGGETPLGSMVFSGPSTPAADAMAFISGFMRPGGNAEETTGAGALPSIVNIQTTAGGTTTGDVTVLSQPEQQFVSKWPEFFKKLSNVFGKFGWVIWPLVFVSLFLLFRKIFGAK